MNELILNKNDTPVVSHITISENTGNDKRSIARLIDTYKEQLESFGRVGFEITSLKTNGGVQEFKIYYLNEDQAIFLMTLLKNNEIVVAFKVKLVTAFSKLKTNLNKPKTFEEVMRDALLLADTRVKELEQKVIEMKPKVEFAEAIGNTEQGLLLRDFCKVLNDRGINIGQNTLFRWMRENKYLMPDNRPYQGFAKYFSVKERLLSTIKGDRICLTTYISGRGQEYFYTKLKINFSICEEPEKIL